VLPYNLPKLPKEIHRGDGLKLWLTLFNAETEEDLVKLEALEVSVMNEAIGAYRHVSATDEFKEIERLRSRARHNEASALRRAAEVEAAKWQAVVADRDAENESLRKRLAELQARLGEGQ
jgi:hypothetical protein